MQRDAAARRGDDLRDPAAHLPGADDEYVFERPRRRDPTLRVDGGQARNRPPTPTAIARVQERGWQVGLPPRLPGRRSSTAAASSSVERWRERLARPAAGLGDLRRRARTATVVGFVSVGPSRDERGIGELYAIYVDPDAWSTRRRPRADRRGPRSSSARDYARRDALGARGERRAPAASTSAPAGSPTAPARRRSAGASRAPEVRYRKRCAERSARAAVRSRRSVSSSRASASGTQRTSSTSFCAPRLAVGAHPEVAHLLRRLARRRSASRRASSPSVAARGPSPPRPRGAPPPPTTRPRSSFPFGSDQSSYCGRWTSSTRAVADDDAARRARAIAGIAQTSISSASPWPPPEQIAARPRPPPLRRSSCTIVADDPAARGADRMAERDRAAVHVHAAPRRRRAAASSSSATDANASLISTRSTSSIVLPARSSAIAPAFAGVRAR